MAEKFLILGSNSFYGSNFTDYVKSRGDTAICLSHPDFDLNHNLDDIYCCERVDYVVNFISKSLVEESWQKPEDWVETNVYSTTSLFRKLIASDIKKFVHVSTPESYGHTEGWVDETYATWSPSTPYGVSRASADMMLLAYHKAFKFPGVITRTANIYGPGQPNHRIVPLAFNRLREGKKVALHGGGQSLRCFIHVKDACAATYLIAKQGSPGQTYHISNTEPVSVALLVRKICTVLGKNFEGSIENAPDRLGKDHAYLLKTDRIRTMGWRDTYTLERGLEDYARGSA
jgi:dTDP-glucose 4,6-dehydratase